MVGCYMLRPFAHPVARCWILLRVVVQSLKPVKLFSQQLPWSPKHSATMLDPFAQLFQHCWGHARSLRMVYKDLSVVSFPRCTAGPNIFGSCCIPWHTTTNTHATTPYIVGATGSCCVRLHAALGRQSSVKLAMNTLILGAAQFVEFTLTREWQMR